MRELINKIRLMELRGQNSINSIGIEGEANEPPKALNAGLWGDFQNLKYFMFCDANSKIMASKRKRKITKVFDLMSVYIETRSSLQCRTHHQKFDDKERISPGIRAALKQKLIEDLSEEKKHSLVLPNPIIDPIRLKNIVKGKIESQAQRGTQIIQQAEGENREEIVLPVTPMLQYMSFNSFSQILWIYPAQSQPGFPFMYQGNFWGNI